MYVHRGRDDVCGTVVSEFHGGSVGICRSHSERWRGPYKWERPATFIVLACRASLPSWNKTIASELGNHAIYQGKCIVSEKRQ